LIFPTFWPFVHGREGGLKNRCVYIFSSHQDVQKLKNTSYKCFSYHILWNEVLFFWYFNFCAPRNFAFIGDISLLKKSSNFFTSFFAWVHFEKGYIRILLFVQTVELFFVFVVSKMYKNETRFWARASRILVKFASKNCVTQIFARAQFCKSEH